MIVEGKVWGTTSPIFEKNNVEIRRLTLKNGKCCSKHKHLHKYNMFFVENGQIKVKIWKKDYNLIDEVILENLQSTIVNPTEYHRFEVLKDSVIYEIYWVELSASDIERETVGGNIEKETNNV